MTTAKQAKANKKNSAKSSGPKTLGGKVKSSKNALTHGLLSVRLFLNDENPGEFQQLMDDLVASLKPVGALELVLVEKIAVSFWRQRRLIRAETAGIELSRRTEHDHIRSQVGAALGVNYPDNVKDSYLQPSMEDDAEYSAYCRRCLDEYFRCHEVLNSGDLERLRAEALLMFEALEC